MTTDATASSFTGVENQALSHPPQGNAPRERTLLDGTVVKWCGECGLWGDHLRAGHPDP